MKYKKIIKQRYKLILQYIGLILIIIGSFTLLPLLVIPVNPTDIQYIKYFLFSSLIAFILGGGLYFSFKKNNTEITLNLKEGGIIVTLSWFLAIFISALPFYWGLNINWTNAIFESVSGWTTTGLSVVDEGETPAIYLLWRSLMQMFGGAGLAVIALSSLLPMQGLGLYNAEGRTDKLLPHVRRSTKLIMQIYIGYIVAGSILYKFAGMSLFAAINHSMAAISTGGFSTVSASIGYWDNIMIEFVTIILMFLGTINFATHYILLQGKFKRFFQNAEIKLMVFLLSLFIPLVMFVSLNGVYGSITESLRKTSFQLISALSTTGFSTIDFNNWPDFSFITVIFLMIIGGGTGSTAGGIKQYRIFIIIKSIYWDIKNRFYPDNMVQENYVWRGEDRWYVKNEHIRKIANYIILYLLTYFAGVLIFLSYGYSLKESLFEFASALGTVGLSIGITSATAPPVILWTETIGMILGRLEFLIILFALIKLWKDMSYLVKS